MSDLTKYAQGKRMIQEDEIKQIKKNNKTIAELNENKVDKNTKDTTYTSEIINSPEGVELKNTANANNNHASIKVAQTSNGGINLEIVTPATGLKSNIISKLQSIEFKNGSDARYVSLKMAYSGSNNLVAKTLQSGVEKTVNIMEIPDKLDEKANKPKKFVLDYSSISISQIPSSISLTSEQKTEIENGILSDDRFNYYIELITQDNKYILRLNTYDLSGVYGDFEGMNKENATGVYHYNLHYTGTMALTFSRTKLN